MKPKKVRNLSCANVFVWPMLSFYAQVIMFSGDCFLVLEKVNNQPCPPHPHNTRDRRVPSAAPNKHINSCLLPYKTKVHYYYCYCVSQAGAKSDPWPLICTFWWAGSVHDGRGRGLAANILTNCKISDPDPRPPPIPLL